MAITITWATGVINVPQADLTFISTGLYELDVDDFRLALKDLEDSEEGINFPTTHNHNAPVTVGGVTLARVVEIINGYTITFEDGQYAVRLAGGNNNIADVMNVNQVSLRSNNSAGLVQVESGGGGSTDWTSTERAQIRKRLGIDGASSTPAATPQFSVPGDAMALTSAERIAILAVFRAWAVESGVSWEQVQQRIAAALSGLSQGAGTAQEKFFGAGQPTSGTPRLTVDFDAAGNRIAVTPG